MAPVSKGPDLKRYMDKVLSLKLNGNRQVIGVLRGYDAFMNLVLDNAKELPKGNVGDLGRGGGMGGMIAAGTAGDMGSVVIRGSSIIQFECLGLVDRQT